MLSSKDELLARCPKTDASLLFYTVQRKNDIEAEMLNRFLCDEASVCDPNKADSNLLCHTLIVLQTKPY